MRNLGIGLVLGLSMLAATADARPGEPAKSRKLHVMPGHGEPLPANAALIVEAGALTAPQRAKLLMELRIDCRDGGVRFRRMRAPDGTPDELLLLLPLKEPLPGSWCELVWPDWARPHAARERPAWTVTDAIAPAVWTGKPKIDLRLQRANDYRIDGLPVVVPLDPEATPYVFASLRDDAGKTEFSGVLCVRAGRGQPAGVRGCEVSAPPPSPGRHTLELTAVGPRGVLAPAPGGRLPFEYVPTTDPRVQRPEITPAPDEPLPTTALLAISMPMQLRDELEALVNSQLALVSAAGRVPVQPLSPVAGEHLVRALLAVGGLTPGTEYTLEGRLGPVKIGGKVARWTTASSATTAAKDAPFVPRLEFDPETDTLRIRAFGAADGSYVRVASTEQGRFAALVPVQKGGAIVDERWFQMLPGTVSATLVLIGADGRELARTAEPVTAVIPAPLGSSAAPGRDGQPQAGK